VLAEDGTESVDEKEILKELKGSIPRYTLFKK